LYTERHAYMRSQTHSTSTHERYYMKPAQRRDGQEIMTCFQNSVIAPTKIIPECMSFAHHDASMAKAAAAASSSSASDSPPRKYVRRPAVATNGAAPRASVTASDEYGMMHPSFHTESAKGKKIPWSDQEIQWIRKYIDEHPDVLSSMEKNATILRAIRFSTAEEKAIFHSHHVYDSGRIRPGVMRAITEDPLTSLN
jgi:hypothetical protein